MSNSVLPTLEKDACFIKEGRLRQYSYKDDQAMDSIVYSLLREDYVKHCQLELF